MELPLLEWCDIPTGETVIENKVYPINSFKMSKYPVTYGQFNAFLDITDGYYNPEWWKQLAVRHETPGEQEWTINNHPRTHVSWYDAVAYCRWLGSKIGEQVRLPTEWEWQWAAQSFDGRRYPWGNEFDPKKGNTIESGISQPTPVERFAAYPSPFGVCDMAGNIWEWCLNESKIPQNVGVGGKEWRAVRGGAWDFGQQFATTTCRFHFIPSERFNIIGFRMVIGGNPAPAYAVPYE